MGGMQELLSQEPEVREMTGKDRVSTAPPLFLRGMEMFSVRSRKGTGESLNLT